MLKCMIVPESGAQAPELSVFTSRSLLGQICNPVNTNLPEQRLTRRNAPNLQPQARIITQATPNVTGKRLNSFDLQIPADQSSLLMSVLEVTKTDLAAIKNDLVATMKDMIKSSLVEIVVVPKPPISNDVDPAKKTSKVSEEYSEDEDEVTSNQVELVLDRLLLTAEEQQNFDSFASPKQLFNRLFNFTITSTDTGSALITKIHSMGKTSCLCG